MSGPSQDCHQKLFQNIGSKPVGWEREGKAPTGYIGKTSWRHNGFRVRKDVHSKGYEVVGGMEMVIHRQKDLSKRPLGPTEFPRGKEERANVFLPRPLFSVGKTLHEGFRARVSACGL